MSTCRSTSARLAFALILAAAVPSPAQQAVGNISGTITDETSAVLQGAVVEIRNIGTNSVFKTASNENGVDTEPNLAVGEYTIEASAPGFKRAVRSGVTLQVNQNARIDITLDLGQTAE